MTAPEPALTPPAQLPKRQQRGGSRGATIAVGALICGYLAATGAVASQLGVHAEEIAGVLPVSVVRVYPDVVERPPEAASGLVAARWMPVWAWRSTGTSLPLMVDGHIGAVAFWPAWLVAHLHPIWGPRGLSLAMGLATLLLLWRLGRQLQGSAAGVATVALAATSPLLVFLQAWIHPDETWSFLGFLVALALWPRFVATGRWRWLVLAAAAVGLAVAAKNTALWTLAAIAVAARLTGWWPTLRASQWVAATAAFLLPLVPQLAFLALSPELQSVDRRLEVIASPWRLLDPQRLAFFAEHFAASFVSVGSYFGAMIDGRTAHPWAPLPGAPLLFGLTLIAAVIDAWRATPRPAPARLLAMGLVLLLVQYVAFYYEGMSLFALTIPWVYLVLGRLVARLWAGSGSSSSPPRRVLARSVLVLGSAWWLLHQGVQVARFVDASRHPDAAMFSLATSRAVVTDWVAAGVTRPWTTTYGVVGVPELLSGGTVRPMHAFPVFHHFGVEDRFAEAWRHVLAEMGPGSHDLLIDPAPSPLDVSPLRDGAAIAAHLPAAIAAARGSVRVHRSYALPDGREGLRWLKVQLP